MQPSEIQDEETLNAWLDALPGEMRQREVVTFVHRAAMRMLPLFIARLNAEWARKGDLTALPFLRCALISGVYFGNSAPEIENAAAAAYNAASAYVYAAAGVAEADNYAAAAAIAAAAVRASAALAFRDAAAFASASASFTSSAAVAAFWDAVRQDASAIEARALLLSNPLWARQTPDWPQTAWHSAKDWLAANSGHGFWVCWYEAALAGRPLTEDWESHAQLLTDIALIPDADWKQGAEHVAQIIAEIEERFRLLAEARRLKAELAPVLEKSSPAPMGHNHPPEALEEVVPAQSILLIWDTLDEVETELEKLQPDKPLLRRAAGILLHASLEVAKYCGRLADKALQNAAGQIGDSIGKWALPIIAGKLMVGDELLRSFAEALARFAGN